MFREKLPIVVRNHIAEMSFTADTWKAVLTKADQVFDSNQAAEPRTQSVSAVTTTTTPEVAATTSSRGRGGGNRGRGRGRGNGGNRGGDTQASQPTTPAATGHKGPRHATAKGSNDKLCKLHYRWGENATYCAGPWKCPMKDIYKAPQ